MKRRGNRRSRKLLLAGLAAAAAATVAAASPLGAIANAQIGAAGPQAPRCAAHGFTVAYSTAESAIAAVRVGSIAAADCAGATLLVTITDRNGNAVAQAGPQALPADGGDSLTLHLDAPLAAEDAAGVEVSVVHA